MVLQCSQSACISLMKARKCDEGVMKAEKWHPPVVDSSTDSKHDFRIRSPMRLLTVK